MSKGDTPFKMSSSELENAMDRFACQVAQAPDYGLGSSVSLQNDTGALQNTDWRALQKDIEWKTQQVYANAAIAGAQAQAYRKSLSDINPTLAEINSSDSPMALPIPTMLVLWKQRHGHKWVSEEEIVEDAYWAVIARRLHGLQMLERMEASRGNGWERVSVFRLKDDENGY